MEKEVVNLAIISSISLRNTGGCEVWGCGKAECCLLVAQQ